MDRLARAPARSPGYAQEAIEFAQGAAFSFVLLLFSLILVVVISIYMLLDMQRLERSIDARFPPHGGPPLTQQIESALWGYVKGQAILSTVIGTSAGVGMYILGVTGLVEGADEYALLFGLWTAFIEVIPYIGPWLSAVPPAIYALFVDPVGVIWVALLFLFIYQVEGHVVVPNVMASALRLHPLLVIFGLLAGGELYGIAGVLVALPTMAGLRAIWEFFRQRVQLERWDEGGPEVPVEVELEPPTRPAQRLAVASPVRVGRRSRTTPRPRARSGPKRFVPRRERQREPVFSPLGARGARARPGDDLRGLPRALRPLAALRAAGPRRRAPPRRLPLRARARPRRARPATSPPSPTSPS